MGTRPGDEIALQWAQSEVRFRALLQHSSDIITVLAADGTVLYNTPATARVLGYTPEELIGRVALEFIHPDDLEEVVLRLGEAVAQPGVPVPVEFRFRHSSGRWVPLEALGINYLDDPGVQGIIVNSRDLSDRNRAEVAYRTLVDHSLQGLAILQHRRIVFANQALADIVGYTVEELLGLAPDELRRTAHAEDLARLSALSRARRSGAEVPPRSEFRVVRKDGSIRWVETYASSIDYHGEPATHVAYVDITERRRADEEKTALLQIARDLTGAFDRQEITDRVLKRTRGLLTVDYLYISYWDPERQVYRPVAGLGTLPGDPGDQVAFPADHPIVTELRHGRAVVINEVDQQPWLSPTMLHGFGVSRAIVAPLFVRDRATGALVAVRLGEGPVFSDDEVHLFEGIARQLALGLGAADRHEAEQEEAAISAALAAVGRELITSLNRPSLLESLCRITTEALRCDRSHTFLLAPRERHLVPAASYGFTEEGWQALRVVQFPLDLVGELIERLRREDVVPMCAGDAMFPGPLLEHSGTAAALFMLLRRGEDVMGVHAAVLGEKGARFSARQIRIARGIAQLASLSIEDARLVAELERANRLKSEFVATMSHELRTPLNIILGYNGLMLEEAFGPLLEEQRDTLERVDSNARSLLELINTTLDMSRLEAGQIPLDLREVAVESLLADIRDEVSDLPLKDGVSFAWDPIPALPTLHTDPAKLKVVLKNLLGNAVKFTDEGSITVSANAHQAGVEFRIADTGIGIDEGSRLIIFEPFRQADGALTRRHGGVGLGLYIVKRLLTELGGTVEVESQPGQGSVFRIWVPLRAASHLG